LHYVIKGDTNNTDVNNFSKKLGKPRQAVRSGGGNFGVAGKLCGGADRNYGNTHGELWSKRRGQHLCSGR
jgi:hypothetical protein